jgi:predicted ester cyclase
LLSDETFDALVVGTLDRANTGKEMYFSGTTIFTLENGRIVKEIGEEGALAALQQLRILPGPNKGKEMFYDVESEL